MSECRQIDCGRIATKGNWCDECYEYRPFCPCCGAFYGEHRTECTVADNYDDCEEGPWETQEQAETFAKAEVGLPWQVVRGANGKWYVMVADCEQ